MRPIERSDDLRLFSDDANAVRSINSDVSCAIRTFVAFHVHAFSTGVAPVEVARLNIVPVREDDPFACELIGRAGNHSLRGDSVDHLTLGGWGCLRKGG